MAITFVNSTEATQGTASGTLVINVPTSTADDDVMIAVVVHSDDTPTTTITPPSGWTQELAKTGMGTAAVSDPVIWVYSRVASSEPASYTWSWDTDGGKVGSILTYRGVDTTTPVPATPSVNAQTGTGTNPIAPSVTTAVDDEWIICAGWCDDDDYALTGNSYPGGMNGRHEAETATGGNGCGLSVADEERATAGSTGTRTFLLAATEERSGITVRLTPAPVGGNFDQNSFRGREDDGSETAATWKAAANTNWTQQVDENFRIRFLVLELDDVEDLNVEFQLQYNRNSLGWNNVTGASSVARSSLSSNFVDAATTTQQIGSGTFVGTNNGMDEVNGLAGGAGMDFTTTVNQESEVEYCLQLRSADLAAADTIQFRLTKGGSALDTATQTPTVTAQFPPAFVLSLSTQFVDGAATTAQLSAPGGSFIAGQIKESGDTAALSNGLTSGDFTEVEFCLQASATSEAAAQYELRIVDEGQSEEKLDSYNATAKVTIAP